MKKLYYIVIVGVIAGYLKQTGNNDFIKGDWHTGIVPEYVRSTDKGIDTLYTYYEYAFTNNYLYTFSDVGAITPLKYEIKKDSMFFYHVINGTKKVTTSGKIVIVNKNRFDFITEFATFKNYRLDRDERGLSNYVIPDSMQKTIRFKNIDSFSLIFKKRYYKTLDTYLKGKK